MEISSIADGNYVVSCSLDKRNLVFSHNEQGWTFAIQLPHSFLIPQLSKDGVNVLLKECYMEDFEYFKQYRWLTKGDMLEYISFKWNIRINE